MAETAKRKIELGPDVRRRQEPNTGLQVVCVQERQQNGMAAAPDV